jgi:hypothetical protein
MKISIHPHLCSSPILAKLFSRTIIPDFHALAFISEILVHLPPSLTHMVAIPDPPVGRLARWVDMVMEDTLAMGP